MKWLRKLLKLNKSERAQEAMSSTESPKTQNHN